MCILCVYIVAHSPSSAAWSFNPREVLRLPTNSQVGEQRGGVPRTLNLGSPAPPSERDSRSSSQALTPLTLSSSSSPIPHSQASKLTETAAGSENMTILSQLDASRTSASASPSVTRPTRGLSSLTSSPSTSTREQRERANHNGLTAYPRWAPALTHFSRSDRNAVMLYFQVIDECMREKIIPRESVIRSRIEWNLRADTKKQAHARLRYIHIYII